MEKFSHVVETPATLQKGRVYELMRGVLCFCRVCCVFQGNAGVVEENMINYLNLKKNLDSFRCTHPIAPPDISIELPLLEDNP